MIAFSKDVKKIARSKKLGAASSPVSQSEAVSCLISSFKKKGRRFLLSLFFKKYVCNYCFTTFCTLTLLPSLTSTMYTPCAWFDKSNEVNNND